MSFRHTYTHLEGTVTYAWLQPKSHVEWDGYGPFKWTNTHTDTDTSTYSYFAQKWQISNQKTEINTQLPSICSLFEWWWWFLCFSLLMVTSEMCVCVHMQQTHYIDFRVNSKFFLQIHIIASGENAILSTWNHYFFAIDINQFSQLFVSFRSIFIRFTSSNNVTICDDGLSPHFIWEEKKQPRKSCTVKRENITYMCKRRLYNSLNGTHTHTQILSLPFFNDS